jgi:hypothetical protein
MEFEKYQLKFKTSGKSHNLNNEKIIQEIMKKLGNLAKKDDHSFLRIHEIYLKLMK